MAGSSNPDERNFGHERVLENILNNYRDAQFLVRPAQTTSVKIGFVLSYIKSFNKNNGRLTAVYLQKEVIIIIIIIIIMIKYLNST